MQKKSKAWKYPSPQPEKENELIRELGIPKLMAKVLINRGITSITEAKQFLYPSYEHLHAPWQLKGVSAGVQRIIKALDQGEKIAVYGDYDVDGVVSAVLLVQVLQHLGGTAEYFLPNRFKEGYGLQKEAVLELKDRGVSLLITTDCGTNSQDEINYAHSLGMEVVVTDHHRPLVSLEKAEAVINPHQEDCPYPYPSLSGVGVAFKLVQALIERTKDQLDPYQYLDLVALGTVADLVPLLDENRVMTRLGLNVINSAPRQGIKALVKASGLEGKPLGAYELAFMLAPALNAAGRLDSADPAAELFLTPQEERAYEIAKFLREENQSRRQTEQRILSEAQKMIEDDPHQVGERVIVLSSPEWHQGVIGIVASRLLDIYYRPVALVALEGDQGKGSARSIAGFNITAALEDCSLYLDRYGGHELAAGFSLPEEHVPALRRELNRLGEEWLQEEDFAPPLYLEGELSEEEISKENAGKLERLAPHGIGNPYPKFFLRGCTLEDWKLVGKDSSHIKFNLSSHGEKFHPILFSGKQHLPRLLPGRKLDIALTIKNGFWKERPVLNLEIKDLSFSDGEVQGDLEVIDHRESENRLWYLRKVLPKTENPIVYGGPLARKKYLQEKVVGESLQDTVVSSKDLEDWEPGKAKTGDVFLFHLPLQAEILEKLIRNVEHPSTKRLHLLYNIDDREINQKILEVAFPTASFIEELYSYITEWISETGGELRQEQLEAFQEQRGLNGNRAWIEKALKALEEAGLIAPGDEGWMLFTGREEKVKDQIEKTTFYRKYFKLREDSLNFQDFLLTASKKEILDFILKSLS